MLSKVNKHNWKLGTPEIIKYIETLDKSDLKFNCVFDGQNGYLLIGFNELDDNISINCLDCRNYRIITGISRLKINVLNKYFWKQLYSFDQNNIMIANKIRSYVIKQFKFNLITNTILGIGGEYYVYFPFVEAKNYIGISNHNSIIEDAEFNLKFYVKNYSNYLVNYDDTKTFPTIETNSKYSIIINVLSIHVNQINWIKDLNIEKLIIITCKPLGKKLPYILKYFNVIETKYFKNFTGLVTIMSLTKKIEYIGLGSNCSVTYHLNKFGLRKKSYPFDWAKVEINQLINVLENNFELYGEFNKEKMEISNSFVNSRLEPTVLLENKYKIKFAHEITKLEDLDNFKSNLSTRIERFRNVKTLVHKIRFVRIEMSRINLTYFSKLSRLVKILEKNFENFDLVIILNYSGIIPITHKKIHFVQFDRFSPDWKMEHLNWKEFLFI